MCVDKFESLLFCLMELRTVLTLIMIVGLIVTFLGYILTVAVEWYVGLPIFFVGFSTVTGVAVFDCMRLIPA
jgi:hypothetical protein